MAGPKETWQWEISSVVEKERARCARNAAQSKSDAPIKSERRIRERFEAGFTRRG